MGDVNARQLSATSVPTGMVTSHERDIRFHLRIVIVENTVENWNKTWKTSRSHTKLQERRGSTVRSSCLDMRQRRSAPTSTIVAIAHPSRIGQGNS